MSLFNIFIFIVVELLCFALVLVGLRWFFARYLSVALRRLKELREEAISREAELKETLERVQQQSDSILERAREESAQIKEKVKKEIEELRRSSEDSALKERQRIIDGAHSELGRIKRDAYNEAEKHAVDLAISSLSALFTDLSRRSLHEYLIREIVDEIDRLNVDFYEMKFDVIELRFAARPSQVEIQRLKDVIVNKISTEVKFDIRIDESLVMGLLVKAGEFVIDASMKNKLEKLRPHLKKL